MLNSKELYLEAGRRAAIARNQNDEGRYAFERDWFNRAHALEKDENKAVARQAFDDGFKEKRNVPKPCYFL